MRAIFDHAGFVAELERVRNERRMSWRQVAAETELEPSTLQRIVKGSMPDLARFAVLLDWLSLPADNFFHRAHGRVDVHLGASQVIEIRNAPSKAFTTTQLRHVRGAIEEIVRALES